MHDFNKENGPLTQEELSALKGQAQILEDYIGEYAYEVFRQDGGYSSLRLNELQRELEDQNLTIENLQKLLEK